MHPVLLIGAGVAALAAGTEGFLLFRKPKKVVQNLGTKDTIGPPPAAIVTPTTVVTVTDKPDGREGIVTTNDPAPAGNLIIRDQPSLSAQMIGAADKDGLVTIVRDVDDTFAEVTWAGGRNPPAHGFARKQFIRLADADTLAAAKLAVANRKAAAQQVPTSTVEAAARSLNISVQELEAATSTVNATPAQLLASGASLQDLQDLVDRMRNNR